MGVGCEDMTGKKLLRQAFIAAGLVLAVFQTGVALEIEGVRLPGRIRREAVVLNLRCLLRYKRIVEAYVAALYLGAGAAVDAARCWVRARSYVPPTFTGATQTPRRMIFPSLELATRQPGRGPSLPSARRCAERGPG